MSFFDDDDDEEDDSLINNGINQRGSSSRTTRENSSLFIDRLRSTVSPHSEEIQIQIQIERERERSKASESIFDESNLSLSNFNENNFENQIQIQNYEKDEEDDDYDEEEEDLNDIKKLNKFWIKERGIPELSNWQGDLIDEIFDKLEQQQKMVNTLNSDPQTSEEEHFKLMLVQTEMERVKYLIRSYVRTRLHKIEKFSHYITVTPNTHHLLSGAELSHAKRYTDLLHTHFEHSVLDSLPEWLRKMDDTYGDGLSMISKPNRNTPVLIYCKRDCGEITLEGGERAALAKGTTHLVKYKLVDRWINLGWAEVL
ncbi:uncharacterized protein I206_105405 [Kwoniella pini CBS 10737]|uniref:DNA replication complex GINS protein SLD5 n=1 Tax=Kwoniella pini CBS 10737 TaxID=1296096 RepID=A0A1B9I4C6_9TREE|nr:uncharacterized protein I206_03689 [Kwoniella pini CBS 10737]OCF50368.1 hypothetical protein I206_03689 [Kwoniella pini CBS 10737]